MSNVTFNKKTLWLFLIFIKMAILMAKRVLILYKFKHLLKILKVIFKAVI